MSHSSDEWNFLSSEKIRMAWGEGISRRRYVHVMPRKAPDFAHEPDWFLPEWMATLRVTQAQLARRTGWPKATMNNIFHGKTSYYRQIINEAATALNIAPFELLMHPDDAMALRRFRTDAIRIAADARLPYTPQPMEVGMGTGTDG